MDCSSEAASALQALVGLADDLRAYGSQAAAVTGSLLADRVTETIIGCGTWPPSASKAAGLHLSVLAAGIEDPSYLRNWIPLSQSFHASILSGSEYEVQIPTVVQVVSFP